MALSPRQRFRFDCGRGADLTPPNKPLKLTVPPQGYRSIIERLASAAGPQLNGKAFDGREIVKEHAPQMKFWQMVSVWGRGKDAKRLLHQLENSEWIHPWGVAFQKFSDLDQTACQAVVPLALSEFLARTDSRSWFLDDAGWLRVSAVNSPGEQMLTTLEVHNSYGGAVLEEVLEAGSFNVLTGRVASSESEK
jgi:hypothetical protein